MNLRGLVNNLSLPRKPTPAERKRLVIALNSWILYYFLKRIHSEFMVKANGGTDSLGVKWAPLSESRRIYKPLRKKERGLFIPGNGTKKEQLANRDPLINIDTERLAKSLKPGRITNGVYISTNPDQDYKVTATNIWFESKVPYADEVQAMRPFLPENMAPWLADAIELALKRMARDIRIYIPKVK